MIVITSKIGQLGNRLFLFASFIAFAAEHGMRLLNPAFDEYSDYFVATKGRATATVPFGRFVLRRGAWVRHLAFQLGHYLTSIAIRLGWSNRLIGTVSLDWDNRCDLDGPAFRARAAATGILLIRGWEFRSERLLKKHQVLIRETFIPIQPHQDRVDDFLRRARADCDVLIGVHIRRGDYQSFQEGRFYYSVREYRSVMERVRDIFEGQKVRFLVCSSERLDPSEFDGLPTCMAPGHELEDLYCLVGCDFIVGPPSTYSMWASFYGSVPLHQITDPSKAISLADFEAR